MTEQLQGLLNDLRNIRGHDQSDEFDLRSCRETLQGIIESMTYPASAADCDVEQVAEIDAVLKRDGRDG